MARSRAVPGLDCEQPFALSAAHVVEIRAAEVFAHSEGVLDTGDVERVHDMRVATRRLRAAMEVFEPCFPRKRFRRGLMQVKALADALGERRDSDVEIEFFRRCGDEIGVADREALAALLERLRAEQRQANEALAPFVAKKRLAKLRRRLEGLVEEVRR